jgi:hypothetical protein
MQSIVNWNEVMNKQARGRDDLELGEVRKVGPNYVLAEKTGVLRTEKFFLPKELAERYDGNTLRFNVTKDEARLKFRRDRAPGVQEYQEYKAMAAPS